MGYRRQEITCFQTGLFEVSDDKILDTGQHNGAITAAINYNDNDMAYGYTYAALATYIQQKYFYRKQFHSFSLTNQDVLQIYWF